MNARISWRQGWNRALAALVTCALVLATACGPYASDEASYSGAFAFWLNRSILISEEIETTQTFAGVQDFDSVFREQIESMVSRQLEFNDQFRAVVPPETLSERHGRIRGVLDLYQEPIANLAQAAAAEPLPSLVVRFEEEQGKLLQAVITCYAESPSC